MSGVDINSVHYNFSYPETLFFPTYHILLFAYNVNSNTPTTLYHCQLYWFSMFGANGNIDLIPVRIGATGYMYDKVSKRLFGNSGTGSFILGPDKVGGGNLLKLWFEAFYAEPSIEMEAA